MKNNIILGALLFLALIGYLADIPALAIVPIVVLMAGIALYQRKEKKKQ